MALIYVVEDDESVRSQQWSAICSIALTISR